MSPQDLQLETLRIAQGELRRRVRETDGPNDSPAIRKYIENLDPPLDFPIPWCAAFVQWCSDRASFECGIRNPLDDVVREAYVDDYFVWAEKEGKRIPKYNARPGDLLLFSFGGERYDHIGILEDCSDAMVWTVIEGNTSDPGNPSYPEAEREGGGIYRKLRRPHYNATTIVRWAP